MLAMKHWIGTSGYAYKHWRNDFYPKGLPEDEWLPFYAERFNSVEINNTFYRLPEKKTFEHWRDQTPKDFCFVIKGSRYLTHLKRLKDAEPGVKNYFKDASGLGSKLSLVLWQLPANFALNVERLTLFAETLDQNSIAKKVRHCFEFRHQSWFTEECYEILRRHNFALCIAHSSKWPVREFVTADFVYLRFHGSDLYGSNYSDRELKSWGKKARELTEDKRDLFAFFNNDARGDAPKNAQTFARLLSDD